VENLVAATLFLLGRMVPGFEIYNYSDEPQMTTTELVEIVSQEAKARVPPFHIPLPVALTVAGFLSFLCKVLGKDLEINTARVRKFCSQSEYPSHKIRSLGFEQQITLEEGLQKTVNWYLNSS